MYGIRGINLAWFHSYLANRKQYIWLGHDLKTSFQNILFGVPRGSILGPLLFLLIKDNEVERVGSIKFLGVLLDEHLSWKEHIRYNENKIAKSISLLYRAKPFLGKHSLLILYYSYIHTYLNCANLSQVQTEPI